MTSVGDVIDFTVGSPYFSTPEPAAAAAHAAIDAGETVYTPPAGIPELRVAVADKFRRDGLDYSPEQVVIGAGAKSLVYSVLAGNSLRGGRVILPAPHYAAYPKLVESAGGTPLIVPTERSDGFKITPKLLRENLDAGCRWLFLNSPSNPTGSVYTADELRAIGDVLLDFPDVLVLSDEIYESFTYQGKTTSPAALSEDFRRRTVTLNGVSKTYGMTGWRIGYAAGPSDLIVRAIDAQFNLLNCASSISQAAALGALTMDQGDVVSRNVGLVRHRDLAVRLLSESPHLDVTNPDGAFYLFPSFTPEFFRSIKAADPKSGVDRVLKHLTAESGVTVTPGFRFGSAAHFRINFAIHRKHLEEGCARIVDGINRFFESEGNNA